MLIVECTTHYPEGAAKTLHELQLKGTDSVHLIKQVNDVNLTNHETADVSYVFCLNVLQFHRQYSHSCSFKPFVSNCKWLFCTSKTMTSSINPFFMSIISADYSVTVVEQVLV